MGPILLKYVFAPVEVIGDFFFDPFLIRACQPTTNEKAKPNIEWLSQPTQPEKNANLNQIRVGILFLLGRKILL